MSGTLYLIVGPSGAGKDTLIDLVRPNLTNHLFVQRHITRPADSGGEAHIELSEQEFEDRVKSGGFCVYWYAHELGYGIDSKLISTVQSGTNVVVNTSRNVVEEFEKHFSKTVVILVTASNEALRERLKQRGRESDEQIERRLSRDVSMPHCKHLIVVDNSGDLEEAKTAMLAALTHKIDVPEFSN
jgi:phosphonate metabolism protein PhnN/1,5-bisphosphokinase (PRPP-forming)